jgi:site-specific DNA-methyltransferase (adenine-specific)
VLYHGDCLQVLRTLSDESIDAVVSDPPYGLSFMGKRWDYDVPSVEIWAECLRVLKPGGHLLAFAGTRTQHRMAVRIEDAGFEIRDMIAWVYGSGFPKSLDVSKAIDKAAGVEREVIGTGKRSQNQSEGWDRPWKKEQMAEIGGSGMAKYNITAPATPEARQWQGWGTSLKPSLEPITVARKPLIGTVAANVLAHGTGGINVDGCRVGTEPPAPRNAPKKIIRGGKFHASADAEQEMSHYNPTEGRWPANLIHDGSDEVVGLFPETAPAKMADRGKGIDGPTFRHTTGTETGVRGHDDSGGSAARFFYCAKASKRDRGESNKHPTVKPTTLMRYLCKLITPPGGLILDPFTGSGSTGRGAVLEGFRFVGMELDAEHVKEAKRRILEVQNGWTDEPEDEPVEDLPGQRLLF